jgi:hypothetical protein
LGWVACCFGFLLAGGPSLRLSYRLLSYFEVLRSFGW